MSATGIKNITFRKDRLAYIVRKMVKGNVLNIGYFYDINDAIEALRVFNEVNCNETNAVLF